MLNLSVNKLNIFLSAVFAVLFGLMLSSFLPLATSNIFFVRAIPFVCIFFLLMVVNVKATLIVLLFARVLLDPLLNATKLNILGQNIGAGGAINLFVIILAFSFIMRQPRRLSRNILCKSWIVFLCICGVTIFFTPAPGKAVRIFLNLVSYLAMAIIPCFLINNISDKKFWLKVLFFSSILPVAYAVFDLLRGGTYSVYTGVRVEGTFTHPNILAFYLVLIITLAFYILKSNLFRLSAAKRGFLWIYLAGLLVILVSTKTRNAWIACWVLFFVYGLLKEKRYLFFSLGVPFLLFLHPVIRDRINNLFTGVSVQSEEKLNSFTWRLELWKSSFSWIKRRFILGYGLVSFSKLSPNFFRLSGGEVASHNTYLELLFETGLLGFLSYIAIYLNTLKLLFNKIRKTAGKLSVEYIIVFTYVLSYMIVCFADNLLYYLVFNWYFWFFIGIILRGIQLDERKENIGNHPLV